MKKLISFLLFTAFLLVPAWSWAESDQIRCTEHDKKIICNLQIGEFIEETRHLLTNGWENTFQIQISLLDSNHSTVARSRLEATQRCYLDPFESPCLVLWTGATKWQRYRDEDVFLNALSHFSIQALSLKELSADNYHVRITLQIMPSASKRIQSISNWFKTGSGDSGASSWSTNSIIGAMLTSHASSVDSDVHQKNLETSQFYIDLNDAAVAVEPQIVDEDASDASEDADELADSE